MASIPKGIPHMKHNISEIIPERVYKDQNLYNKYKSTISYCETVGAKYYTNSAFLPAGGIVLWIKNFGLYIRFANMEQYDRYRDIDNEVHNACFSQPIFNLIFEGAEQKLTIIVSANENNHSRIKDIAERYFKCEVGTKYSDDKLYMIIPKQFNNFAECEAAALEFKRATDGEIDINLVNHESVTIDGKLHIAKPIYLSWSMLPRDISSSNVINGNNNVINIINIVNNIQAAENNWDKQWLVANPPVDMLFRQHMKKINEARAAAGLPVYTQKQYKNVMMENNFTSDTVSRGKKWVRAKQNQ
jgi:uncharacterized LabA/DUF88 family protein